MPSDPRAEGRRARDQSSSEAIDERKLRSLAEPLDVRWRSGEPCPAAEVRNPIRRTRYLTLWPRYPERDAALCTCTDFARRGLGDCKHLEAAWRWLSEPSAPPPPGSEESGPAGTDRLWEEIARRLAGPPPLTERDVRQIARVGELLFRT